MVYVLQPAGKSLNYSNILYKASTSRAIKSLQCSRRFNWFDRKCVVGPWVWLTLFQFCLFSTGVNYKATPFGSEWPYRRGSRTLPPIILGFPDLFPKICLPTLTKRFYILTETFLKSGLITYKLKESFGHQN